jgi:GT2 family glycosyltransferase
MSKPTFSIIAPNFNECASLPELYQRVRAVMDQTGEPWELIIVDDGSTDGSTQLIKEIASQDERVRRPPEGGPGRCRQGVPRTAGTALAVDRHSGERTARPLPGPHPPARLP